MRKLLVLLAVLLVIFTSCDQPFEPPNEKPWLPPVSPTGSFPSPVTDGEVRCMVADGDTVYAGCSFRLIGPYTGCMAVADWASGKVDYRFPAIESTVSTATVLDIQPDGRGGWLLGGQFTTVDKQARLSLARISAGGELLAWDPGLTAPGTGFIASIAVFEDTV